jgi:hypothetical protein
MLKIMAAAVIATALAATPAQAHSARELTYKIAGALGQASFACNNPHLFAVGLSLAQSAGMNIHPAQVLRWEQAGLHGFDALIRQRGLAAACSNAARVAAHFE